MALFKYLIRIILKRPLFYISYISYIRIFLYRPEHLLIPKPATQQITSPVSLEKPKIRNMPTWPMFKRSAEPKKVPYQLMEKDPVTILYIMHTINYSGFNYICINDHHYKLDTFFIVHGGFTRNPNPFNGNKPVFIDSITLVGQEKYEYFNVYPERLLIKIEHTTGMDFTTMFLLPNSTIDSVLTEAKKIQATKEYIKDEAKQH